MRKEINNSKDPTQSHGKASQSTIGGLKCFGNKSAQSEIARLKMIF